jgi:hypothetical protein
VSYIAEGVRREKVMRVFVALLDAATVRQAVADAPVIGNGAGVIPRIHVDDAAATVLALDHEGATQSPGASNARAKRELGWTLRYLTWRVGFVAAHSAAHPQRRDKRLLR